MVEQANYWEMVDHSSDSQERSSEVQVTVVDKNDFENYIKNVISALDGVTDISALEVAISEQIAQESIKKFLNDGQCHALLIQKTSNKGMSMFNCP